MRFLNVFFSLYTTSFLFIVDFEVSAFSVLTVEKLNYFSIQFFVCFFLVKKNWKKEYKIKIFALERIIPMAWKATLQKMWIILIANTPSFHYNTTRFGLILFDIAVKLFYLKTNSWIVIYKFYFPLYDNEFSASLFPEWNKSTANFFIKAQSSPQFLLSTLH